MLWEGVGRFFAPSPVESVGMLAVASVGVIGAAVAIYYTGYQWIDPVVAIAIGLWVLPRTWILLRDTTNILLQGVPRGVNLAAIRAEILKAPGVASVHDLHLWSVAGDDVSLTAHVVLRPAASGNRTLTSIASMLKERFGIEHSTVQIEGASCEDADDLHV